MAIKIVAKIKTEKLENNEMILLPKKFMDDINRVIKKIKHTNTVIIIVHAIKI